MAVCVWSSNSKQLCPSQCTSSPMPSWTPCWKLNAVVKFSPTSHHEWQTADSAASQRPIRPTNVSRCVSQRQAPLRVNTRRPSADVINTDRQEGPGEHWVVVWFDGWGRGEYFDSFGLPAVYRDIEDFILRHCQSYLYNQRVLQDPLSSTCGLYCMYYVARIAQTSLGSSVVRAPDS